MRGYAGLVVGLIMFVILVSIGAYVLSATVTAHARLSSARDFAQKVQDAKSSISISVDYARWTTISRTLEIRARNTGTIAFDLNSMDIFVNSVYEGNCATLSCSDTTGDWFVQPGEYFDVNVPLNYCPSHFVLSPGPAAFPYYSVQCSYYFLFFQSPPTPADGAALTAGSAVEVLIYADTNDVNTIYLDWNGAKMTYYPYIMGDTSISSIDSNNVLAMSFNNVAAVGENYSATPSIRDYSPYENNGIIQRAQYTSTGRFGGAFEFNTDNNILVPNSTSLNPSSAITVEGWVKTSAGKDEIIVGKNYAYLLGVVSSGVAYFNFYSTASGDWNCYLYSDTNVGDGQWHHIAATYDSATGTARIYVDGVLDNSASCSGGIASSTDPVYIGTLWSGWEFNGIIDDVQIWSVAKTPEEIWNDAHAAVTIGSAQTFLDFNTPALSAGTYTYYGWASTVSGYTDYTHDAGTGEEFNATNPRVLNVS